MEEGDCSIFQSLIKVQYFFIHETMTAYGKYIFRCTFRHHIGFTIQEINCTHPLSIRIKGELFNPFTFHTSYRLNRCPVKCGLCRLALQITFDLLCIVTKQGNSKQGRFLIFYFLCSINKAQSFYSHSVLGECSCFISADDSNRTKSLNRGESLYQRLSL